MVSLFLLWMGYLPYRKHAHSTSGIFSFNLFVSAKETEVKEGERGVNGRQVGARSPINRLSEPHQVDRESQSVYYMLAIGKTI